MGEGADGENLPFLSEYCCVLRLGNDLRVYM